MGDNISADLLAGLGPKKNEVPKAAPMSAEQIAALQQQIEIQNQQLAQERQKQELLKTAGPELTYNPLTTGPDGKIGLREEFQLEGPEKFVEAERGRLAQEQAGAADTLQQQIAQQQAQQRAQMASRGGIRGGNQALMSRFSMRDALMGQQQLGRQAASQRGELESKGYSLGQSIREKNLQNLMGSVKDVEQFNLEKWKKQKEVEATKATADATRAAGGGGGKK
jgi:hypothetical protein